MSGQIFAFIVQYFRSNIQMRNPQKLTDAELEAIAHSILQSDYNFDKVGDVLELSDTEAEEEIELDNFDLRSEQKDAKKEDLHHQNKLQSVTQEHQECHSISEGKPSTTTNTRFEKKKNIRNTYLQMSADITWNKQPIKSRFAKKASRNIVKVVPTPLVDILVLFVIK